MWTGLVGTLATIFGGWVDRKSRVAEANAAAQIENAGKVIEQSGWKDEFVVLIWSMPAIMAFIPGLQSYSEKGFKNLATAPEWYIVGWVSISLAIYGIKPATKKLVKWREKTNKEA
jgi:hypothetical protein